VATITVEIVTFGTLQMLVKNQPRKSSMDGQFVFPRLWFVAVAIEENKPFNRVTRKGRNDTVR
jgi:hypothetical protein